jgi:ParB family chromosome partitioning protein
MSAKIETDTESGTEVFIPLNKLKKSPRNARKTPHSETAIEAYAASIAAKGILQNLVVEPELDVDGATTGFYLVTIGEGRRLAQLLRVKRKQIKKTEPIRCRLDTANDPHEISLDENVTRTDMHPADQYEAFRKLADERGYGAEDIAARFGVTAHVVRQRMRLGAISPKLMQAYREEALTLDQLMAFAITEDHAWQEGVYDRLTSWHKEPHTIRRMLTETHVAATDRRAIFLGAEAYTEAGGVIIRDLFTEDRGGFYEDAGLLDRLAIKKLEAVAEQVRAEGWTWATAHIDYPHAHGLRRTYPQPVALSAGDEAAYEAAQAEFNALSEQYESADELPDDVDQRFAELEAEIERIDAQRQAFAPDDIARGGALVVLNHDGTVRVERGLVRPEDETPEPEAGADGSENCASNSADGNPVSALDAEEEEPEEDGKPLSDLLVRDLTAHRTLGLRLALGEQPDIALLAVTHALEIRLINQCLIRKIIPSSASIG